MADNRGEECLLWSRAVARVVPPFRSVYTVLGPLDPVGRLSEVVYQRQNPDSSRSTRGPGHFLPLHLSFWEMGSRRVRGGGGTKVGGRALGRHVDGCHQAAKDQSPQGH